MMFRIIALFFMTSVLSACASSPPAPQVNPYEKFFHKADTYGMDFSLLDPGKEPSVEYVESAQVDRAINHIYSLGFIGLGSSEFTAGVAADKNDAISFGQQISASHILVMKPILLNSKERTITLPQTNIVNSGTIGRPQLDLETNYVQHQITVNTIGNGAFYFAKLQNDKYFAPYGWVFLGLTPEMRASVGRNTGVAVTYVREGSSAFNANVMEGDVVIEAQGRIINGSSDMYDVLETLPETEKSISVKVLRKGKEISIPVPLGARTSAAPL